MNLDDNKNNNDKENNELDKANDNSNDNLNKEDKVIEVELGKENQELYDLLEEVTKNLPKNEQKKMKKFVKTLGIDRKTRIQKICNFFVRFIEKFCICFVSNFVLFGIFASTITYKNNLSVLYFVLIFTFYQTICRTFIKFNFKIFSKSNISYLLYLIVSIYLTYGILNIAGSFTFNVTFYLCLYYILSEALSIVSYLFIKRHQLLSIFKN